MISYTYILDSFLEDACIKASNVTNYNMNGYVVYK